MPTPAPEPLLTPRQVAERYGISVASLATMRSTGRGPAYIKPGGRLVRYRWSDLFDWELGVGKPGLIASERAEATA